MKEQTFTQNRKPLSGKSGSGWLSTFVCVVLCICASYVSAQDSPETALELTEGEISYRFENADGLNTVYYVYEAPEGDSKLIEISLDDSSVSVTVSTDGTLMSTVNGCILEGGKRRIYPVQSGQKVFLILSVDKKAELSFVSTIQSYDLSLGKTCESPVVAAEEQFYIRQPDTYDECVYVSYTCPEDGVLEMHFTGYVYGQIQEGCDGMGTSFSVSYDGGKGEYVGKTSVKSGVTYILAVKLYSPVLAQFILTHPEEGASCDAPFAMIEGENILPKDAGVYWYRFQASKNGFLLLSSDAGLPGGSITVQTSCESYSKVTSIAGFFDLRCGVSAGTVYLVCIEKTENTDEDVKFQMVVEDAKAGDSFDNPIDITSDMKGTVPQYDGTYFFKVSVPEGEAKFMVIDAQDANLSGAMTMATVFPADNQYSQLGSAKDYLKVTVESSKAYIIKWAAGENMNTPFDFTVTFEDIEKGDVCQNPLEAVLGENVLPEGEVKYFSYVPEQSGWLQVSSELPLNVVFPMSCDVYSGTYPMVTSGFTYKIEVTPDKEYIIKFSEIAFEQSFVLEEIAYREGETCDLPFDAADGDNAMPDDMQNCWFRYIPEQDGMLKVTSDVPFESSATGSSQIVVYLNGCESSGHTIIKTDGLGNTWFEGAFVVSPENVVLINVRTISLHPDKSLTLSVRDLLPGEACSNPIVLEQAGELELPVVSRNNPVWYELNLDPGMLRIYSDDYFSMSLYDSCDSDIALTSSVYDYDTEAGKGQYLLEYDVQNPGKYLLKLDGTNKETKVTVEASIAVGLSDLSVNEISITGYDGMIFVNSLNPRPVRIYDLTGRLIVNEQNCSHATYTVPRGFYIVRVGSVIQKVLVE